MQAASALFPASVGTATNPAAIASRDRQAVTRNAIADGADGAAGAPFTLLARAEIHDPIPAARNDRREEAMLWVAPDAERSGHYVTAYLDCRVKDHVADTRTLCPFRMNNCRRWLNLGAQLSLDRRAAGCDRDHPTAAHDDDINADTTGD